MKSEAAVQTAYLMPALYWWLKRINLDIFFLTIVPAMRALYSFARWCIRILVYAYVTDLMSANMWLLSGSVSIMWCSSVLNALSPSLRRTACLVGAFPSYTLRHVCSRPYSNSGLPLINRFTIRYMSFSAHALILTRPVWPCVCFFLRAYTIPRNK